MEEMNLRNYAYLGDAVWELFVREKTTKITENSKKLHNYNRKCKSWFSSNFIAKIR